VPAEVKRELGGGRGKSLSTDQGGYDNGYVNADMIYRELSQSHHTDQGNSDLKVPVKAKVHIGTSQSHRTDQGNSDEGV
jgi:hypothetical protein